MFNKLSAWLYQISTGKLTLLGLLTFGLMLAFVLPQQAKLSAVYSQGVGSPDQTYFYSAADLYEMAEAYAQTGAPLMCKPVLRLMYSSL